MRQVGETGNSLKMVFRNHPENERIVRTTAAVFVSILDPTLEEISDFKTAVSEAVTNAIIHAYPESGGDIEAYFKRENKKITVIITDYGVGIKDVKKSMQPLYTTLHTQERSGQDVCSLHQVIYQNEGDEIHLEDKLEQQSDLIEQTVDNIYIQELLQKLNEQERKLIELRYFQNQTQAVIAGIMGISQVQVSRMEKKILEKLRMHSLN